VVSEHWNGAVWKVTSAVRPHRGSELQAVTAVSPTNLWAVGSTPSKRGAFPLAEHYNGKSWSPVVLPTPNKNASSELDAVSAASASGSGAGPAIENEDFVVRDADGVGTPLLLSHGPPPSLWPRGATFPFPVRRGCPCFPACIRDGAKRTM
jgi:hypothetical protein